MEGFVFHGSSPRHKPTRSRDRKTSNAHHDRGAPASQKQPGINHHKQGHQAPMQVHEGLPAQSHHTRDGCRMWRSAQTGSNSQVHINLRQANRPRCARDGGGGDNDRRVVGCVLLRFRTGVGVVRTRDCNNLTRRGANKRPYGRSCPDRQSREARKSYDQPFGE